MFRRVLIANRGEIAVRVMRACHELGIETVAVYSSIDADAAHVRAAHQAFAIGEAPASDSYLAVPKIIDVARRADAEAVHPGYGFLSENAEFADACERAGLAFIGPPAGVIEKMGSKIGARALMASAGLPVVPGGVPDDQTDAGIRSAALAVGVPLIIKASSGGGGKGMRVVRKAADLEDAIGAARREALAAFGDGTLYVERCLENPRHVEVQIFGDAQGQVVHLGERECSLQRRHQKIVEESPSCAVDADLRRRLGDAAVAAARAAGYRNAGTVEFLVDAGAGDTPFYFLEMNTRLQVEHPVTEAVTGLDLVHAQLAVAAGRPLPWRQADIVLRGHAVECRVYAEDPASDFLPQAGPLLVYREPAGPGLRVDSGVREGDEVSVHYDPLLAKLVATAETREAALARAASALQRFAILGIRTNIPFLMRILEHPRIRSGEIDTALVDAELDALLSRRPSVALERVAIAAAAAAGAGPATCRPEPAGAAGTGLDPWDTLQGWTT